MIKILIDRGLAMKKIIIILLSSILMLSCTKKQDAQQPAGADSSAQAAMQGNEQAVIEGNWQTNLEKAIETAKKENKNILVDFTGSDWCGWCIKLKDEVFSQKAFQDFAAASLVLVEIDFPQKKEQSDEVKKYNKQLAEKYGIQGFPTIILLDKDGNLVGQTGYQEGGAENYVAHLKTELKIK